MILGLIPAPRRLPDTFNPPPFRKWQVNRVLSGLGDVPSDFELARYRDTWYQGVYHGWKNGWNHLSDAPAAAMAAGATADTIDEMVRIQKRQAFLQTLSTIAIVTLAVVSVGGCLFRKKST